MDANGSKFWQLADARQFPACQHALWDSARRVLRLASERQLQPALSAGAAHALAQGALEAPARAIDAQEGLAWWDGAAAMVQAASRLPGVTPLLALGETPTDLCMGHDGVLYVALAGRIRLHDVRARFADAEVALAGFSAWRLAPSPTGGVWALERSSARLAQLRGYPGRARSPRPDDYHASVFRPNPENCDPPRLELRSPALAGDEQALALCVAHDGRPRVLSWRGGAGNACVRSWLPAQQRLGDALLLRGADYAYALAALAGERVIVRVPGRRDAPAFDLAAADADAGVDAAGEVYPLAADAVEAPFCNGPLHPPQHPRGASGAQPLHPLSIANLARRGEAANHAQAPDTAPPWLIDSGDNTTVWHRLYAEADIPEQCGFTVWLAASNAAQPPARTDTLAWQPHRFGSAVTPADLPWPQVPRAAWEHHASELPSHPGFLCAARVRGRRGLFSVLIQNSRQRVRTLVGRYLWLRVELLGNGRSGPQIAALRIYGGRFDYAEHYLPRLYRETLSGAAASAPGEQVARVDAAFTAALDRAGAIAPLLHEQLLSGGVALGGAPTCHVEAPGRAWLLSDGHSSWRLRREPQGEGEAIVVYRPSASGADFNARLLANFEGLLTQLEDRIASAHLLSEPQVTAPANLPWLASWIGVSFDAALPTERRRAWLAAAPELARWHGTLRGLALALDVASGGGVRSGAIVVLEDFRLRRILATLLGVDLSEERDPLLPGLIVSGNSVVGDSLFLGDAERAELMALYRAQTHDGSERQAVLAFYGQLAHRASVLVHQEVDAQDLALLRRVAEQEAPAHVGVSVSAATWPLLVGVASLVGVDTYLGPAAQAQPARVQQSVLGMGDYVLGQSVLDPRLAASGAGAGAHALPTADAGADLQVAHGSSFFLDASASRAAEGRHIASYRWRLLPPATP